MGTVKKGSSTSVEKAKYASEVTIVSRVRKSVQILKGVKGNQQKNVRPTAKRNGVIVDAQVVLLVDHVKESAWNDGCRFSKVGYCKRDCEERFRLTAPCEGGDDSASKICFGGESCGSCKRECQENEGCGRESTGQCKGYCQEKWGPC